MRQKVSHLKGHQPQSLFPRRFLHKVVKCSHSKIKIRSITSNYAPFVNLTKYFGTFTKQRRYDSPTSVRELSRGRAEAYCGF